MGNLHSGLSSLQDVNVSQGFPATSGLNEIFFFYSNLFSSNTSQEAELIRLQRGFSGGLFCRQVFKADDAAFHSSLSTHPHPYMSGGGVMEGDKVFVVN